MNIEKIVKELEKNLTDDPPKYEGFISTPGLILQENVSELMKIIQISNILPKVLQIISPAAIDLLEKKYNDQKEKISIRFSGELTVTQENKEPIITNFEINDINLFDTLRQQVSDVQLPKEVVEVISQATARLNSYYFLALYSYLDLYSLSIYKLIISKLDETKIFELIRNFRVLGNPLDKINQIDQSLKLKKKYGLNEDIINSWKKDFKQFINQRHFIAHRDPVVELLNLDTEFKGINKIAQEKSKEKINELFHDVKSQKEVFAKISSSFSELLHTLYFLMELSASCFKYLALIDLVVDDYIKNNK